MHTITKLLELSAAPMTGQGSSRLRKGDTDRLRLTLLAEYWRSGITRLIIILALAVAVMVVPGASVAKLAQASDATAPEVSQTLAVLTAAHDHRGSHPVVGDTPPGIQPGASDLPRFDTTLEQIVPGRVLSHATYPSDIRPPVRAPPEI